MPPIARPGQLLAGRLPAGELEAGRRRADRRALVSFLRVDRATATDVKPEIATARQHAG
jgi:hypothetical protein